MLQCTMVDKSRNCSNYLRSLTFQSIDTHVKSLNEIFNTSLIFNRYRSLVNKTGFTGILKKSDDMLKQRNQLIGQKKIFCFFIAAVAT